MKPASVVGHAGAVPVLAQPAAVHVVPDGQQVPFEQASGAAAGQAGVVPPGDAVQRPEGSQPLPAGQQRAGAASSKYHSPKVSAVRGRWVDAKSCATCEAVSAPATTRTSSSWPDSDQHRGPVAE